MAWFILARLAFIAAVSVSAVMLRPLGADVLSNIALGAGLAVLAVGFEWLLRDTAVTHMLGAFLGGAVGLLLAKGISEALFWIDHGDQRVAFMHSFILLVFPYIGAVVGGRKGEWLEPARLIALFRAAGPERHYKILDTSVIIDGRIADLCETGFIDGAHGDSAVRPEGTAAGGRLVGLDEAQPRPPRPRHPAEDPEDVGRRGGDLRRRLSRGQGSRPQADRAGPHAVGQDRHQRLQPQQGGPAARRRRCSTSTSWPTP